MAVNLDSNSSLYYVVAPVYPFTLSAWFKVVNLSSAQIIAASARSNGFTTIGIRVETSGAISAIIRDNAGAETTFLTTSTIAAGTWNHAAVVFSSSSLRKVYLNGALELTSTAANSASLAQNRFSIGVGGSFTYQFSGDVAEVAVWDTSLIDDEIASLGKSAKPYKVKGNNLLVYCPLVRSFHELSTGFSLTTVNSPSVSNHPRVY